MALRSLTLSDGSKAVPVGREESVLILLQPTSISLDEVPVIDENSWAVFGHRSAAGVSIPDPHRGDFTAHLTLGTVYLVGSRLFDELLEEGWPREAHSALEQSYDLKLRLLARRVPEVFSDRVYYETSGAMPVSLELIRDTLKPEQRNLNSIFRDFLARHNVLPVGRLRENFPLRPLSSKPLISIVIRHGEDRGYFQVALSSALGSTYSNFEVIVVDDGSAARGESCSDPRIRTVRAPERGLGHALNEGVYAAKGEIVVCLDDDDLLLPDALEVISRYCLRHPTEGLIVGRYGVIDARGERIFEESIDHLYNDPDVLLRFDGFGHPKIWRPEVFRTLEGARYPYAEDYDLVLRASELVPVGRIDAELYLYRLHGQQTDQISAQERSRIKNDLRWEAFQRRRMLCG